MEINVFAGSSMVKFVYKSREDEDEVNSSVRTVFVLVLVIIFMVSVWATVVGVEAEIDVA